MDRTQASSTLSPTPTASTRITRTAWMRALVAMLPLLALGGTTGCSFGEVYLHDPLLREVSLSEAQLRYTSLVRWSAFHKAARFVEPDAREDFIALLPAIEDFRFTDFESEPVSIDEETGEATIRVTYKAYSVRSPFEITVKETQQWKRHSMGNSWQVTSEFEGLGKHAGIARAD